MEGFYRNMVHPQGGGEIFIAHVCFLILSVAKLATLVKICGDTRQVHLTTGLAELCPW